MSDIPDDMIPIYQREYDNCPSITVGELIEVLNKFPKDDKVVIQLFRANNPRREDVFITREIADKFIRRCRFIRQVDIQCDVKGV